MIDFLVAVGTFVAVFLVVYTIGTGLQDIIDDISDDK